MEDAFGAEVEYAHDSVGRVTDITGSGFGGVTTYASNREFRAWGAVKAMDYGNSLSMTADYNNRMKMTDFSVPGIMGAEIDYQPEGSAKYVHDTVDNKFDRAYTFDHAARLSTALTGEEARGGTTADGPYHESFAYDAWGHMVDHDTRHWTENYTMSAVSYTNDRHAGWTYDAAGSATEQEIDTIFAFDAAGRLVSAHNPTYMESCGTTAPYLVASTNVNTYDGDGETTKMAQTRSISGGPGFTITKYYLRSTALGGEVIDLITGGGAKQQGMVFADGGILAKQWKNGSSEEVRWEHTNPATGVIWRTDDTGTLLGREELDPLGANVGSFNPYTSGSGGGSGGGDCEGMRFHTQRPAANDLDGNCYLNGVAAPCSMAMNLANNGGGTRITDLDNTDEFGRPRQQPPLTPAEQQHLKERLDEAQKGQKTTTPEEREHAHRLSHDPSTADQAAEQVQKAADDNAPFVVEVPIVLDFPFEAPPTLPGASDSELGGGKNVAREALKKGPCAALFGDLTGLGFKDPLDLLNTFLRNRLIVVGTSYAGSRGTTNFESGTGAITVHARGASYVNANGVRMSAARITVNRNGFYFTGKDSEGNYVTSVIRGGYEGLSQAQIQGAVLVHELLHVFNRIRSDDPRELHDRGAQSRANSRLVQEACFPDSGR